MADIPITEKPTISNISGNTKLLVNEGQQLRQVEAQEFKEKIFANELVEIAKIEDKANKSDVANLTSATPNFVDYVTEMTDSSKVYVLTKTGTFTWCIITSTVDMALNKTFIKGEEYTSNIGETIEINDTLGLRKGIYIKPDSNNALYSTAEKLDNHVVANFDSTNKINNVNYSISGEYILLEKQIKFVDNDTYNKGIAKITEKCSEKFTKVYSDMGVTYTTEGTNTNIRMGLYYNTPTYVKNFKPAFSKSFGIFKWYFFESIEDFISGSTIFTKGEEHTANIGDTIEINTELSSHNILVLNSITVPMLYKSTNNIGLPMINVKVNDNNISATSYANSTIIGDFKFIENSYKFVTHEILEEKKYISHYDTLPYSSNPLFGKKIIALGDSMVAGQGVSPTWLDCIATRNSMVSVNYGIGGNCLAVKADASSSAMCVRYTEMDAADYIIIFGGTNDGFSSIPLGEETSTNTSEFYDALNTLLQGIITKYPIKKIGFITTYIYDSAKSEKM